MPCKSRKEGSRVGLLAVSRYVGAALLSEHISPCWGGATQLSNYPISLAPVWVLLWILWILQHCSLDMLPMGLIVYIWLGLLFFWKRYRAPQVRNPGHITVVGAIFLHHSTLLLAQFIVYAFVLSVRAGDTLWMVTMVCFWTLRTTVIRVEERTPEINAAW